MHFAYMALVVSFVLVIVLHAWFVRRLTHLGDRARAAKGDFERRHREMVELTETVSELRRGKDSNALSIQALEREIEDLREKIRAFLEEHPELKGEFGSPEKVVAVEEETDEAEEGEADREREREDEETETTEAAKKGAREE